MGPDVAETLGKASLGPVGFDIVENMGKVGKSKEMFMTSGYVKGPQRIRARTELILGSRVKGI